MGYHETIALYKTCIMCTPEDAVYIMAYGLYRVTVGPDGTPGHEDITNAQAAYDALQETGFRLVKV